MVGQISMKFNKEFKNNPQNLEGTGLYFWRISLEHLIAHREQNIKKKNKSIRSPGSVVPFPIVPCVLHQNGDE